MTRSLFFVAVVTTDSMTRSLCCSAYLSPPVEFDQIKSFSREAADCPTRCWKKSLSIILKTVDS